MEIKISLEKLSGLVVPTLGDEGSVSEKTPNFQYVLSLNAEMMRLGFVMSEDLFKAIYTLKEAEIKWLAEETISILRKIKGADVAYVPMYPNFPKQVMNASYVELYLNALTHYWTGGEWKPDYDKLPREFSLEKNKFKEIKLITEEQFSNLFKTLLSSNESLSDGDKTIVEWFLDNYTNIKFPEEIPYKETLCIVISKCLEVFKGTDAIDKIVPFIKTATDVLRIATYLSGGDVSLASNTRFKSFPRGQRRFFVKVLEKVITEEDIKRHKNKWNKLFHSLHVCEYSNKVCKIATKVRNNRKLNSTAGKVQALIDGGNIIEACTVLQYRPGEFARKLDFLLREAENQKQVLKLFGEIVSRISTRVLMQLYGHFNGRNLATTNRIIFPKGRVQKAVSVAPISKSLSDETILETLFLLENTLEQRFSSQKPLGKVWINPLLDKCPLPTQQRSVSDGVDLVARGTRLPFENKNTLRFFVYWVGMDIDLSASLHDANFNLIEHISYTNLKSENCQACHSGDITNAPNGAAEFIDITVDKAVDFGARYVVMNVFVYSGPTFKEHEKCYAGWMGRCAPNSNEIFDPKTVETKVDLVSDSKYSIPVIFDLFNKESIWVDLTSRAYWDRGGINIESNKASIEEVLQSMLSLDNKATLHQLFSFHTEARGELVENKEDAETVFDIEEGITPRDINLINSEFLR